MTVPPVILYEDAAGRALEPFALLRPVTEMRAGAVLIRERWAAIVNGPVAGRVGARHLVSFDEPGTPPTASGLLGAGLVVANARFAPALDVALADADTWTADGQVVAVRLSAPLDVERLADGTLKLESLAARNGRATPVRGWWIDRAWDFVRHLGAMLAADIPYLGASLHTRHPATMADVRVIGAHEVFIENGATIEPFVVLDAEAGPVLVRRGAIVQAFTRLRGPCAIGEATTIHGGRIANASIGDHCRVHGEVNTTLFFGHTNKAHDGFMGHSVIGRWANVGAGTTTSNLKNSYGTVQMWTPGGVEDSGLQFLGSLIGDHVKLAIGTLLNTGTLVGAGANVFTQPAPRVIPPFSWGGGPEASFALDKFLQVIERVMARRGERLDDGARAALVAAYALRWTP